MLYLINKNFSTLLKYRININSDEIKPLEEFNVESLKTLRSEDLCMSTLAVRNSVPNSKFLLMLPSSLNINFMHCFSRIPLTYIHSILEQGQVYGNNLFRYSINGKMLVTDGSKYQDYDKMHSNRVRFSHSSARLMFDQSTQVHEKMSSFMITFLIPDLETNEKDLDFSSDPYIQEKFGNEPCWEVISHLCVYYAYLTQESIINCKSKFFPLILSICLYSTCKNSSSKYAEIITAIGPQKTDLYQIHHVLKYLCLDACNYVGCTSFYTPSPNPTQSESLMIRKQYEKDL